MTKIQNKQEDLENFSAFDRFIPSRHNFNFDFSYHSVMNDAGQKKRVNILDQDIDEWTRLKCGESIGKLIGCDYSSKRILPITCSKKVNTVPEEIQWPVKPRQKPTIGTPNAVLDLPNFMNLFDRNVLDWGKSNYIAAALWDSVYLWNADNSNIVPIPSRVSTAIRWHPDGSNIFIASSISVKVWDVESSKVKYFIEQKHCYHPQCTITAVDWFPLGKVLATGCNFGAVTLLSENRYRRILCEGTDYRQIGAVISISFSPNGNYIASSTFNSIVTIWTFPDGIPYLRIKMSSATRGLSWHPTKPSYLCLGDTMGRMSLWNISKQCLVAKCLPPKDRPVGVYCLSFSELTGELVTSHVMHREEGNDESSCLSQINVLSSFERVVDRIGLQPDDKVMYLKWNPDGTQIATAGSDETLQLWNFTPNSKNRKREGTRKKQRFPSELMELTENFTYTIR